MKSVNNYLRSLSGLLLAAPTTYVIFISLMKYGFGWGYFFDNSQPFLERLGIKESLGWNINLFILLGPVAALAVNIPAVLRVHLEFMKERIDCQLSLLKSWSNLAVITLSSLVLLILFVYLMGENCR